MTDEEKIIAAIGKQRWFRFKNNPQVIFDRDTDLLWADLNYFPYGKNKNRDQYYSLGDYTEVRELLKEKNAQRFGDCDDWTVPTSEELWRLIEDKTFPYQGGQCWYIQNRWPWCVQHNGRLQSKDLDYSSTSGIFIRSAFVLPCSHSLVSRPRKPTLQIFADNNLEPIFNDNSITQLYLQTYIDKPKPKPLSFDNIVDTQSLLDEYDLAAVDRSPIRYYAAVQSVADILINALDRFKSEHAEKIDALFHASEPFAVGYVNNPNFNAVENMTFAAHHRLFTRNLSFGADKVKRNLHSLQAEAQAVFDRLDDANSTKILAEIESEPRAGFAFLVENSVRMLNDACRRVAMFDRRRELIELLIEQSLKGLHNYETFKTKTREEFRARCKELGIDDEIAAEQYDDWNQKRFEIEQRQLKLIEKAFAPSTEAGALEREIDKLIAARDALYTMNGEA